MVTEVGRGWDEDGAAWGIVGRGADFVALGLTISWTLLISMVMA
jgi:hypothetical protein